MKRSTIIKTVTILVITFILIGGILLLSQDPGDPNTTMDVVERSLEMSRHERLIASISENNAVKNVFTTDGCSGGLSRDWEQFATRFPEFAAQHGALPPWQECCVIHDLHYHGGGMGSLSANESYDHRKAADLALKTCVIDTGMQRSSAIEEIYGLSETEVRDVYEIISEMMYRAVRVGGMPCSTQPWRWGYGLPLCHESID
jgi:hypothetical protein